MEDDQKKRLKALDEGDYDDPETKAHVAGSLYNFLKDPSAYDSVDANSRNLYNAQGYPLAESLDPAHLPENFNQSLAKVAPSMHEFIQNPYNYGSFQIADENDRNLSDEQVAEMVDLLEKNRESFQQQYPNKDEDIANFVSSLHGQTDAIPQNHSADDQLAALRLSIANQQQTSKPYTIETVQLPDVMSRKNYSIRQVYK